MPLVEAREAQFKPRQPRVKNVSGEADGEASEPSQAWMTQMQVDELEAQPLTSTSKTSELLDEGATTSMEVDVDVDAGLGNQAVRNATSTPSKRSLRRAKQLTRHKARETQQPPVLPSHDIVLRSGKRVRVEDRPYERKQAPRLLLNRGDAVDTRPPISTALVIGINEATRALEEEIRGSRSILAGAKSRGAAVDSQMTLSQDKFRLFIPAPNPSTRRQRRQLREACSSSATGSSRDFRRSRSQRTDARNEKIIMPEHLDTVPQDYPALRHALKEALEEVDISSNQHPERANRCREIITAIQNTLGHDEAPAGENPKVSNSPAAIPSDAMGEDVKESAQPAAPDVLNRSAAVTGTGVDGSPSSSKVVKIPSPFVAAILKDTTDILSDATRSILISLFVRCDPLWFTAWNKANRVQPYSINATPTAASDDTNSSTQPTTVAEKPKEGTQSVPNRPTERFPPSSCRRIRLLFVAKEDINPIEIAQHLLTAVAAKNSVNVALRSARRNDGEETASGIHAREDDIQDTYLVPLSKGAEARLADLLAIRRCAVLGFAVSRPFHHLMEETRQRSVCRTGD